MPLVYNQSTGQINETTLPASNTKVLALHQGQIKEVFVDLGGAAPNTGAFTIDGGNASTTYSTPYDNGDADNTGLVNPVRFDFGAAT